MDQVQPDYDQWIAQLQLMRRAAHTQVYRAINAQNEQRWANLGPALKQADQVLQHLGRLIDSPPLGL